jgi:hypothetical protein
MRRLSPLTLLTLSLLQLLVFNHSAAQAQSLVPSSRDLERLNLDLAWKAFVPVDNRSDGIAVAQLIEDRAYVQTRTNVLIVLDAATGTEIWRTTLPKRNVPAFPVAANRQLLLVVNGPRLFILDRSDGKQKFNIELPSTVAAGLAADNHQCFIVLSNERVVSVGLLPEDVRRGQRVRTRVNEPDPPTGIKTAVQAVGESSTAANRSPSLTLLHSLRPPFEYSRKDTTPSLVAAPTLSPPYRTNSPNTAPSIVMVPNLGKLADLTEIGVEDKPRILWELRANRRMEQAPLMYGEFLIVAGADRSVFVCNKYADRQNRIIQEYLSDATLSAPLAQYGPEVYLCLSDGNVYSVTVEDFRISGVPVKHIKRYLSHSPIDRKPVVTDDSLYLPSSLAGLARLDRQSFEKVWTNSEVDQVFAVSPSVIYAGDRHGNLVVLDRARGLKLATLNIRAFNFPISNMRDDRLFLATDSGLLLCLHDRKLPRAELLRPKEPRPPIDLQEEAMVKKEEPKKEEPKKEEPKKEEPKKEEPKTEEPKKEEPKKEEPKKEEPKKEEPKKEEPKKEEPK